MPEKPHTIYFMPDPEDPEHRARWRKHDALMVRVRAAERFMIAYLTERGVDTKGHKYVPNAAWVYLNGGDPQTAEATVARMAFLDAGDAFVGVPNRGQIEAEMVAALDAERARRLAAARGRKKK